MQKNIIVYNTKQEAIDAMKSNVLGLDYGEQGICKYISPEDPSKSEIILGVGTGDIKNPVTIVNHKEESTFHLGMNPPEDNNQIWVDTKTEYDDPEESLSAYMKLLEVVRTMHNKIQRLENSFANGIDAGTTETSKDKFLELAKGTKPKTLDEMLDEEDDPDIVVDDYAGAAKIIDGAEGKPDGWTDNILQQVRHLCIKHDTAENLANYVPKDWELIGCDDPFGVFIGYNGRYHKLTGLGGEVVDPEDPDNPKEDLTKPMKHLDFITENENVIMRMKVNEKGKLITYNALEDDDTIVQETGPGSGERNKGLIISMVYAGSPTGNKNMSGVCSHSFIELYNESDNEINLRGLSLQVGVASTNWTVVPLVGILPSKKNFLVRLNACADPNSEACLVHIDNYDLDAPDVKINSTGVKVYLCVGTEPTSVDNPWTNVSGVALPDNYIDLVGLRRRLSEGESYGEGGYPNVNAFETTPADVIHDTMGAYRVHLADPYAQKKKMIVPGDTNNNFQDFRSFDFTSSRVTPFPTKVYFPRTREDKGKDMFWSQTKMSEDSPEMVTISIGAVRGTRTFNWTARDFHDHNLYIQTEENSRWHIFKSGKSGVSNIRVNAADGTQFMTHKVIISDLKAGFYTYKVGRPGFMSDEFHFVITEDELSTSGSVKYIQVSDQQGWSFSEYAPWGLALDAIMKEENEGDFLPTKGGPNFIVNTGDMTQNGSRPAEWLDYYNEAKTYLPYFPQMNTVGNNDLCPNEDGSAQKALSTSFVYYYNYQLDEGNPQYDKDGKLMRSVYAYDYGCAHFICLNSNEWVEDQKAWFNKHIEKVREREVQPEWIIVKIHDAPFNITTHTDPQSLPGKDTGHRDSPINDATNGDYTKRYAWSRILEDAGVDIVMSGHKHTYSRTYPIKEDRSEITIEGWNIADNRLPVNYLKPIIQKGIDGSKNKFVKQEGYIVYAMSQATGFKLQSNKDTPATNVEWLANYFPGEGGKSSAAQKYPTYILWEISPTQIKMTAKQVKNICHGGKLFDPYGIGEPGVTQLDNITVSEIDTFTLTKPVATE